MFERKAVFEFPKTEKTNLDELELELIDAGLESIEEHDDTIEVYAPYTNFGQLSKALEDRGIEVTSAKLERIPTNAVEYSEEQLVDIEKLIDKLEEDDDIQAVYTNIA
jgi:transcriptional/translational regulatory protein YebC/TACO1